MIQRLKLFKRLRWCAKSPFAEKSAIRPISNLTFSKQVNLVFGDGSGEPSNALSPPLNHPSFGQRFPVNQPGPMSKEDEAQPS